MTTAAPLPATLEKIVKRLQNVTDPKQKYERLILFARKLPEFPDADRIEANKVSGCTSQVFITAQLASGDPGGRAEWTDSQRNPHPHARFHPRYGAERQPHALTGQRLLQHFQNDAAEDVARQRRGLNPKA
jgi:hypothetical protein